jgi:hypothetical protein
MSVLRKPQLQLALLLAVGVILRTGVALYLGDVVDAPALLTDQRSYHALGVRLLQGHGYSFAVGWYPFTPPNTPTAHWSFLYPLFVAAVYGVFGVHPLAVRLAQAVLGGILLPWVVYRLARRLVLSAESPADAQSLPPHGSKARGNAQEVSYLPLVAAALAAGYAYFVLYAATIMTETFYIVALLWSMEIGLRVGERLRAKRPVPLALSLELGLSLVLATLLRQSILPWLPLFFLWMLWQYPDRRRWWKAIGPLVIAGLVLVLGILPWTIRNYRVYDQFLLLNSNTGYALYSSQHPLQGVRFQDFFVAPLPKDLKGTNEAQWDRELFRIGLQFIRDDPLRYLRLCGSRIRAYFEFWPAPDTTLLHSIGRVISYGLLLPFMLYGLYLCLRGRQGSLYRSGLNLLYLFALFYPLVHILTWAMVRYRLPVDALGLIFASRALEDLYVRGRRWQVGVISRQSRERGLHQ